MSEEQFVVRDHRRPGWFWGANEIIDVYGPRLGAMGVAVYMALARHANERSQTAWPSIRRLAGLLATGFHQVLDALAVLEREGLIRVVRSPGCVSVYQLLDVPATVAAPATVDQETVAAPATDRCRSDNGTVAAPATEQNILNNTQRTTQHGCVVSSSVLSELLSAGVSEQVASDLVRDVDRERIQEVLAAAAARTRLANRAGWIVAALQEGWNVADPDASAPLPAAHRTQLVSCAFRRSPALGQCPSEEEGGAWMPWCRGCERCPGGPRPPGNGK